MTIFRSSLMFFVVCAKKKFSSSHEKCSKGRVYFLDAHQTEKKKMYLESYKVLGLRIL